MSYDVISASDVLNMNQPEQEEFCLRVSNCCHPNCLIILEMVLIVGDKPCCSSVDFK